MSFFQLSDTPLIAWYVLVLVFLEGLLSADNALVLAVMVRHLPRHDQRRVLQYGIWGAIGFRVVAVLLATELRKFWIFKVIGGLYLLYLAISHFVSHRRSAAAEDPGQSRQAQGWWQGFWGTVTKITLADIAFSIDSILAAVGVADEFPDRFGDRGKMYIVLTGGVLGIITMRFVVRYFVRLLDRFPGLAEGAYVLVAWIGLKLVISGLHDATFLPFHISDMVFWMGMGLIAVLSLIIKPRKKDPEEMGAQEALDMLESDDDQSSADDRSNVDTSLRDGTADGEGPQAGRSTDNQVHQNGTTRGSD